MKLNINKSKKSITPEEVEKKTREKTAQQWLPVADILKNIVYRKDNHILAILKIQPDNLELLSKSEQLRKINTLSEGWNGENEGWQIFCIGRPVDLNSYLEWLQDKAKNEHDFTRKMLLRGYIQQASQTATSGETIERRFYLIISKRDTVKAEQEIISRIYDFQDKLSKAELSSEICGEDEIMEVYSLFANPIEASIESTQLIYEITTTLN